MGKSSIRTTEKYKQAILEFPAPQSISDVRSWFGLINQVAYSFSMSSVMAPLRTLLSPSSKFHWDAQLEETFQASKLEIIRLVSLVYRHVLAQISQSVAWVGFCSRRYAAVQ